MGCRESLRRVCHWGPVSVLSAIVYFWGTILYVTRSWCPPNGSASGLFHATFVSTLAAAAVYHFLSASIRGPGHVPLRWQPWDEEGKRYLQVCDTCRSYKVPRAHHCSRCQKCVLKMDHHCVWINNCLGHFNLPHFIKTLLICPIVLPYGLILCLVRLYKYHYTIRYNEEGQQIDWELITPVAYGVCCGAMSLATLMLMGTTALLVSQLRLLVKNRTGIEGLFISEAEKRKGKGSFCHPYDLGLFVNLKQVFWDPPGNGTEWPVLPGYNQYSIIVQQLRIASETQMYSRRVTAIKSYSGTWFPLDLSPLSSDSIFACICIPCKFEPRMPFEAGDLIQVSSETKYWLFGRKVKGNHEPKEEEEKQRNEGETRSNRQNRGWFPLICVEEVTEGSLDALPTNDWNLEATFFEKPSNCRHSKLL